MGRKPEHPSQCCWFCNDTMFCATAVRCIRDDPLSPAEEDGRAKAKAFVAAVREGRPAMSNAGVFPSEEVMRAEAEWNRKRGQGGSGQSTASIQCVHTFFGCDNGSRCREAGRCLDRK